MKMINKNKIKLFCEKVIEKNKGKVYVEKSLNLSELKEFHKYRTFNNNEKEYENN